MKTEIKNAQEKLAYAVKQVTAAQKGFTHIYEYELFETQNEVRKIVFLDGAYFATFILDQDALADGLKDTVEDYYFDRNGLKIEESIDNFESALKDWLRYEDDYSIRKTITWKRASFDSGEPYTLEVPSDAAVCESCDIVLGSYTAEEIFAAFLKVTYNNNAIFSGDFESWSVFGLAYVKYYLEAIQNKGVCFMPYCDEIWNEVYKELSK